MVTYPPMLGPAAETRDVDAATPIEYAAAVDRYLDRAALGVASRRVYRISLAGWAWPLVGKPVPSGADRRRATPPVVPLALLDDPGTGGRLAAALAAAGGDDRRAHREPRAVRAAQRGWLVAGAGLDRRRPDHGTAAPRACRPARPLGRSQVADLFGLATGLREQAFWRVLYDSGAPAGKVLALDAHQLDLVRHRVRARIDGGSRTAIEWQGTTSQILRWLLSGRTWGPVFLTDRRAPAGTAPADVCPLTGQARMSYRRAAEIFAALTRPLDPSGRGWTLHQLSAAKVDVRGF